MYEDDKNKVTIDVTDYEWKELLHMCIDLHMSPDAPGNGVLQGSYPPAGPAANHRRRTGGEVRWDA